MGTAKCRMSSGPGTSGSTRSGVARSGVGYGAAPIEDRARFLVDGRADLDDRVGAACVPQMELEEPTRREEPAGVEIDVELIALNRDGLALHRDARSRVGGEANAHGGDRRRG